MPRLHGAPSCTQGLSLTLQKHLFLISADVNLYIKLLRDILNKKQLMRCFLAEGPLST
jgi:hypothetical protein